MKHTLGNNQDFLQEYADTMKKVEAAKVAINHLVGTFNKRM